MSCPLAKPAQALFFDEAVVLSYPYVMRDVRTHAEPPILRAGLGRQMPLHDDPYLQVVFW